MNIWILNHYAISPDSKGGTRHFDLARELTKEGHHVRIFASSFNHFDRKEKKVYNKNFFLDEKIEGVNFTWLKTPPYRNSIQRILNIITFSLRLNKVLKKSLKKETPDLIIGSSVHPLTPLVGIRRTRNTNILFYFEERDLWPQTFIDFGIIKKKSIISKILFKLESYLYTHSDRVIFLFDKAHEYAQKRGLNEGKNIYLPNGYNSARVEDMKRSKELENLLNSIGDKKICIYTGSMGEANHMMPLLELANNMKSNNDYHFLFIGDGPQKDNMIQFVAQKEIQNVTFQKSVNKEYIPYLLNNAYCALISMKNSPLYKWGFSMNKIYDYMALGLPIIMYSNLKELGPLDSVDGIISSDNLNTLEEKILQVDNVNRVAIKEFAKNNYSWEVLSETLIKEIEKDLKLKEYDSNM